MPVEWVCPDCDAPLSGGVLTCSQPACGAELVLCPHPDCGQLVPAGSKFCCHCREKMTRTETAPPPAPAFAPVPPPTAPLPPHAAQATSPAEPLAPLPAEALSALLAKLTMVGSPGPAAATLAPTVPAAAAVPAVVHPRVELPTPPRPQGVAVPNTHAVFGEYQLPGTLRKGEQAFFGLRLVIGI